MVHGLFRASGIVMFYGLHHDFGRRKVGVSSECLGHFWRAEVGHFWKAPKAVPNPNVDLAKKIKAEIRQLNVMLTQARQQLSDYLNETGTIYDRIREIASLAPRPVPVATTPNPWSDYEAWRIDMENRLVQQGQDTVAIWSLFTVPCQKTGPPADPPPAAGPWLQPARTCVVPNTATQPSSTPPAIPAGYGPLYQTLTADLTMLPAGQPDQGTYNDIQTLKANLDARQARIAQFFLVAPVLMPPLITKYSTDMQAFLAAITVAHPESSGPIGLGSIPGPPSGAAANAADAAERRILLVFKALAPSITYTVSAQNEIINSLLTQPTPPQKQAIATISILYASPRFEGSSGALLSWLPNRTFANYTDVKVTGGVPAPADVRINMTKTISPLVVPYVGANYRLSPEFTWLGGRRGAVYATAAIMLNPYNTQVEYAAGFSVSWRYLMFSPMFHVGHPTHLTQGEQVGELWCKYGDGATATSSPPACAGSPPAPTTKNYWTGAFALGIGVRIPTTFSSSNH